MELKTPNSNLNLHSMKVGSSMVDRARFVLALVQRRGRVEVQGSAQEGIQSVLRLVWLYKMEGFSDKLLQAQPFIPINLFFTPFYTQRKNNMLAR
jgi:hypothetical protein